MFSVALLGERLSSRTALGFFVTTLGVSLYKLVPKGSPGGEGMLGPGRLKECGLITFKAVDNNLSGLFREVFVSFCGANVDLKVCCCEGGSTS